MRRSSPPSFSRSRQEQRCHLPRTRAGQFVPCLSGGSGSCSPGLGAWLNSAAVGLHSDGWLRPRDVSLECCAATGARTLRSASREFVSCLVAWMARGRPDQQIADQLFVSIRTVHSHLRSAYASSASPSAASWPLSSARSSRAIEKQLARYPGVPSDPPHGRPRARDLGTRRAGYPGLPHVNKAPQSIPALRSDENALEGRGVTS